MVVRLIAVALTFLGGVGVIAYLAGLLLIPAEGSADPLIREGIDGPERNLVVGFGVVAAIALLDLTSGPFHLFDGGHLWFAGAAIAGAALLIRRDSPEPVVGAPSDDAGDPSDAPTTVMPVARRRRGRGAAILGAALLTIAAASGILAAIGGTIRWDVALCAAVIATGAALVLAAPLGGARILIPLGALLALMSGAAAAADLNLRGGAGDHLEHPVALTGKTTEYHLAAGRLMVDLRDVKLLPGVTRVSADVGLGQLVVRVPARVRVELAGHASAGDVEMLGRDSNGFDARREEMIPAGRPKAPVLQIDAHAGFGQVRVLRAGEELPDLRRHPQPFDAGNDR